MPSNPEALALRRAQLLQRSGELRQQLAQDAQVLTPWLGVADGVRLVSNWLQRHPEWAAVGVATLVVLKPQRAMSLALKAWSGWKVWRRVRSVWAQTQRR